MDCHARRAGSAWEFREMPRAGIQIKQPKHTLSVFKSLPNKHIQTNRHVRVPTTGYSATLPLHRYTEHFGVISPWFTRRDLTSVVHVIYSNCANTDL